MERIEYTVVKTSFELSMPKGTRWQKKSISRRYLGVSGTVAGTPVFFNWWSMDGDILSNLYKTEKPEISELKKLIINEGFHTHSVDYDHFEINKSFMISNKDMGVKIIEVSEDDFRKYNVTTYNFVDVKSIR